MEGVGRFDDTRKWERWDLRYRIHVEIERRNGRGSGKAITIKYNTIFWNLFSFTKNDCCQYDVYLYFTCSIIEWYVFSWQPKSQLTVQTVQTECQLSLRQLFVVAGQCILRIYWKYRIVDGDSFERVLSGMMISEFVYFAIQFTITNGECTLFFFSFSCRS